MAAVARVEAAASATPVVPPPASTDLLEPTLSRHGLHRPVATDGASEDCLELFFASFAQRAHRKGVLGALASPADMHVAAVAPALLVRVVPFEANLPLRLCLRQQVKLVEHALAKLAP